MVLTSGSILWNSSMNEQIFAPIQTKQENSLLDLDLQHTDEELTVDRDISSDRHHIRENVSFKTSFF
jgi:hypothetical protein